MDYGSYKEELSGHSSIRRDFGESRDWFAAAEESNSDQVMEVSPPAANENYYDQAEHVRSRVSDYSNYQPQTLGLGIGGQICNIEREHMFDKVVTPSDVGKLNRLVIPKQHAEKYFPLDSSSNEKGLILNFEDLTGKSWRFRYSYWGSSQSYVMTKGWSRFVKEKKLDAGDIVSFQRGVAEAEKHRLFIDWRRRPIATLPVDASLFHTQFYRSTHGIPSWSPLVLSRPPQTRVHPSINFQIPNSSGHYHGYNNYMGHGVVEDSASMMYLTSPEIGMVRGRGAGERIPVVFDSVPVVQAAGKKVVAAAAAKKLRLFGVNMECPISSEEASTSDEFEISPAHVINQYRPSSSTSRIYCNGSSPFSNKGKTSMSLDLEF